MLIKAISNETKDQFFRCVVSARSSSVEHPLRRTVVEVRLLQWWTALKKFHVECCPFAKSRFCQVPPGSAGFARFRWSCQVPLESPGSAGVARLRRSLNPYGTTRPYGKVPSQVTYLWPWIQGIARPYGRYPSQCWRSLTYQKRKERAASSLNVSYLMKLLI